MPSQSADRGTQPNELLSVLRAIKKLNTETTERLCELCVSSFRRHREHGEAKTCVEEWCPYIFPTSVNTASAGSSISARPSCTGTVTTLWQSNSRVVS